MVTVNIEKSADNIYEYLKFGFIPSFTNETMLMYQLYEKTFYNEAMKAIKIKDTLKGFIQIKKKKILIFFMMLKEKFRNQLNLKKIFKASVRADNEGRLKIYIFSLNMAKERKIIYHWWRDHNTSN